MCSWQGCDLKEDSHENFHQGANITKVSKTAILKVKVSGFHGTLTYCISTPYLSRLLTPCQWHSLTAHQISNRMGPNPQAKPIQPTLVSPQWIQFSEPSCAIITEVPTRGSLEPWAAAAVGDFTNLAAMPEHWAATSLSSTDQSQSAPLHKNCCTGAILLFRSDIPAKPQGPAVQVLSSSELLSQSMSKARGVRQICGNRIWDWRDHQMPDVSLQQRN